VFAAYERYKRPAPQRRRTLAMWAVFLGPSTDVRKINICQWDDFIRYRLADYYHDETPDRRRRELMVHIAALALAALEADDRQGTAMQP